MGDTKQALQMEQMATGTNKTLRGTRLPEIAAVAKTRVFGWRRRAATVAVGSLALVMAYGVVFGHNGLTAFARKRQESKQLETQVQTLTRENERLRGHVERLQSDAGAIEHAAREQLHYTRPGEVIITLPAKPSEGDK